MHNEKWQKPLLFVIIKDSLYFANQYIRWRNEKIKEWKNWGGFVMQNLK